MRLSPEQEALREELRAWLAASFEERFKEPGAEAARAWQRRLHEGGWGAPAWPREFGGRASGPIENQIFMGELEEVGAARPMTVIGVGWAGPAIIAHGSARQKQTLLPRILDGSDIWCQLFSEPDAGSDLAGLRTRAEKRAGGWAIKGQKIWTSYAQEADLGILLARTDPASQRQAGITCFAFRMRQPGVEVRPIKQMDGRATFNEVFIDGALARDEDVIGEVGDGWRVAITTLANERVSLAGGAGALWGDGPTLEDLLRLAHTTGTSAAQRQRLASLKVEWEAIRLTRYRVLSGPGSAHLASIGKLASDRWGQQVTELAVDLLGMGGLVEAGEWQRAFLFGPALTIGGGTTEIQRNILAQRALGLPRER
jgi:alkylation response protein AidB-like acyl-CoA dehydrogenase